MKKLLLIVLLLVASCSPFTNLSVKTVTPKSTDNPNASLEVGKVYSFNSGQKIFTFIKGFKFKGWKPIVNIDSSNIMTGHRIRINTNNFYLNVGLLEDSSIVLQSLPDYAIDFLAELDNTRKNQEKYTGTFWCYNINDKGIGVNKFLILKDWYLYKNYTSSEQWEDKRTLFVQDSTTLYSDYKYVITFNGKSGGTIKAEYNEYKVELDGDVIRPAFTKQLEWDVADSIIAYKDFKAKVISVTGSELNIQVISNGTD
ncbi:MAG: hypothetical protein LBO69_04055 [Ignavibacteria bacterium]|jgi:hypothetical protein|nr:hypothetical protein [Ignavibacteria bacterium]